MVSCFTCAGDEKDRRLRNKRGKSAFEIFLLLTGICNCLLQFGLGDDNKGLSLRKVGARGVTCKFQNAIDDLRVNRRLCEVSYHAPLQDRVAKFHKGLLRKEMMW